MGEMFYCYVTAGPLVLQDPPITSHNSPGEASGRAERLFRLKKDCEEVKMYDAASQVTSTWDGRKWSRSGTIEDLAREFEEKA